MPDTLTSAHQIELAEAAADQLLDTPDAEPAYEPNDLRTAEAAVQRLGWRLETLPPAIKRALEGARNSAKSLSSDRLQGIAEVVQNADDVGATQVRMCLRPTDLLISHDGRPVRLEHVLALATPWLSTKGSEAAAFGRFGIGLMALHSLSTKIEIHCHPYHVELGDPTVEPIAPPVLPAQFQEPGWTTLRIPLEAGAVESNEVEEWLNRWGDAGLLFLRHVSRITLLAPGGKRVCELALSREDNKRSVASLPSGGVMSRHRAEATDGRSWMVYSAEVPTPPEVERAYKATEATTPIAVGLPLWPVEEGQVYAGLPVAATGLPLFVNGQFDPLTNRQGFADNAWNRALVPLVAELWSRAALDLFSYDPQTAWLAMPTEDADVADTTSPVLNALTAAITAHAWQSVARDVLFAVPSLGLVSLSQLAVEAPSLEGILTEAETARLADLPAAFPTQVRDQAGRWRSVLDSWRAAGADIPESVSVEQALALLGDPTRPVDATIALVEAGLDAGLKKQLRDLPCVVADDGRRLTPPAPDSPEAFATEATALAQRLGLVTALHRVYLDGGKAARKVLAWLEDCGALFDGSDDQAVIRRLAAAGQSGHALVSPLTGEQAQALRAAFELIDPVERTTLAPNIGRAISLEAYVYEGKQRRAITARPVDAYLPSAIDHGADSFAAAAKQTSGLIWLSDRYADLLRSPVGRKGVGSLQFLRLLGTETTPKPRLHPELEWRFTDSRRGLLASVSGGPEARRRAMAERGATHTLDDYHNPDLLAVVKDIAQERRAGQRRKRASALLATMGRAWERLLSDYAEVDSAEAYRVWQKKGLIRAYWLWQAADVAWLDDERGIPRRPGDLRIRTAGAVAVYGENASGYLHKDLDQLNRRVVLGALGVASDTSRSELVDRLVEIRASTEGGEEPATADLKRDVAIVYLALAEGLATTARRTDLSPEQVRVAFRRNRLVLTNLGWRSPDDVLAGLPIFGDHKAFALEVKGAERLWRTLRLREPTHDDCLEVLRELARQRHAPDGEEEVVLLQTLRALAVHYSKGEPAKDRRLAQLALWTSNGWVRNRPVYAIDDPVLAASLQERLPIWQPGGELEQFRPLLAPLRISEIRAADAEVTDPTLAEDDAGTTALFRSAIRLLREDLARHEPELAKNTAVSWENLEEFTVGIHPNLTLRVRALGEECVSEVAAKVDTNERKVFVRHSSALPRVDEGGRALAALFQGNPRHLAQAWRTACDEAAENREAKTLELAQERSEREQAQREREIDTHRRTIAFKEQTAAKRRTSGSAGRTADTSSSGTASEKREQGTGTSNTGASRMLVDPQSLRLLDPQGRIEGVAGDAKADGRTRGQSGRRRNLAEPRQGSGGSRSQRPVRQYTEKDKETIGLDLLQMVLGSDIQDINDLRSQRNVGADAMDELGRYYELKVYAEAEPAQIDMTDSEVQRAQSNPDFFLVVVSGLEEGSGARPTVRVIVDPLNQLRLAPRGNTTWSGVHEAKSLVYQFGPADEPRLTGVEEE